MKTTKSIILLVLIFIASISFAQIRHTKFSKVVTFDPQGGLSNFYNTTVSEIPLTGGYFLANYKDNYQVPTFKASSVKLDYKGNIVFDTIYSLNTVNSSGFASIVNNKTTITGNATLYSTSFPNGSGVPSPYLLKTDLNGNLLWHYNYSDDVVDLETKQLIATQDGGYLMLGRMTDYANQTLPESGFAIKVAGNGVMQWNKLYLNKDTMTIDFQNGVQTKDGGFLLVGVSHNFQGGAKPLDQFANLVSMVRTDGNGNNIWNKGITLDTPIDNNYGFGDISCGMFNDSNAFVSFSVRDTSVYLNKFAIASININTGVTNWVKYYSLPASEEINIRKAIADGEGNVIVTGSDYNISTGAIFKIDITGSVVDTKRFTFSTHSNFPYHTIRTQDGGFMHVNEIDGKNILLVKTDKDLDPSCPDIDSTYFTLTGAAITDSSYFGIADSVSTLPLLTSSQMSLATPELEDSKDSLICSCSNALTGIVYDGANPAVNAKVFLFKKGMIPLPWQPYDTTTTDALGSYSFVDFPTDSFIVMVKPDPTLQPNAVTSYYMPGAATSFKWDSAWVFSAHCDSGLITKDVNLINISPMTGNSSLNGYVFENTGGFSKGSFIPGDPIPGMDITVEQSPGGIVGTETTNGGGFYDLPNLDNSATYVISIDLPGLPNDSVYTITINLTDTILDSLNFYVDTTGIYIIDNSAAVGVNVIDFDDLKVGVYPNPSSDNFNLKITAVKPEEVEYELTNEFGQSIINNKKALHQGENNIILGTDDLSNGIYFLKIKQANKMFIKKLIKL